MINNCNQRINGSGHLTRMSILCRLRLQRLQHLVQVLQGYQVTTRAHMRRYAISHLQLKSEAQQILSKKFPEDVSRIILYNYHHDQKTKLDKCISELTGHIVDCKENRAVVRRAIMGPYQEIEPFDEGTFFMKKCICR